MVAPQFLQIFRCPRHGTALSIADLTIIESVNAAIAEGQIVNCGDQEVSAPLSGGLINEDRSVLYPIHEGVPCLIAAEGIHLKQLDASEQG